MYETFNMGVGFCCVVAGDALDEALSILGKHHPGTRRIGEVGAEAGTVRAPGSGIVGDKGGFRPL
jgi:phosphoribosylformylglycinamidine cyclo-ligase